MSASGRTWGEAQGRGARATVRTLPRKYLNPGDVLVSAEPCELTTILGSCVAVCLWDARRRLGGMNHFLLPRGGDSSRHPGRFGNTAMRTLLERILAGGSGRGDLVAKVFGGAEILARQAGGTTLSQQNVSCAEAFLSAEGLTISAADTGGARGRHITFLSDTGAVSLRRL